MSAKAASVPAECDVAVIGGGSAGYAAGRTAAALGVRTVVVDGARELGGLCILRGCMPSKSLLESAHRWHDIGRAREFGLVARAVRPDIAAVQARKQGLIANFAGYRRQQLTRGAFTLARGHASFLDAHTLHLAQGRKTAPLRARAVILATGSVVPRLPVPGLWETGCLSSDELLGLKKLPKSVIVLGGGVIAVELGQYLVRMGVKTTLLQRSPHLVRALYDPDVSAELERALRADGMEVITGVELRQVDRAGKAKRVVYRRGGRRHEAVAEEIFCALGRVAALEGLGLEKTGVAFRREGHLLVQPTMATSLPHLFVAGDAVGAGLEVVHIAIQQAEAAARNAVRFLRGGAEPPEEVDYRLNTFVTFTDPEIAVVGLTEAAAQARGVAYLAACYPFGDHGKAMIGGHRFGFVKLLAEKTRGEIVGAQIIGPHASDLIHELIAVMRYRGTAAELAAMPHYHPTLAEIVTYPAEELAARVAEGAAGKD